MRWQFVVVVLGLYGLVAFMWKLRTENKRLKMELDSKKEQK